VLLDFGVICETWALQVAVIPAKAGIQLVDSAFPKVCGMDSSCHNGLFIICINEILLESWACSTGTDASAGRNRLEFGIHIKPFVPVDTSYMVVGARAFICSIFSSVIISREARCPGVLLKNPILLFLPKTEEVSPSRMK